MYNISDGCGTAVNIQAIEFRNGCATKVAFTRSPFTGQRHQNCLFEDEFENLERLVKDMQEIEFTIQQGKLYVLHTRSGKRTAPAALRIAYDLWNEDVISQQEAMRSLKPHLFDQLLRPTLDPKAEKEIIAKGLPASPGAAGGKVPFPKFMSRPCWHGLISFSGSSGCFLEACRQYFCRIHPCTILPAPDKYVKSYHKVDFVISGSHIFIFGSH